MLHIINKRIYFSCKIGFERERERDRRMGLKMQTEKQKGSGFYNIPLTKTLHLLEFLFIMQIAKLDSQTVLRATKKEEVITFNPLEKP